MAENKPDWLAKAEANAEGSDNPALEAVVKIGTFVDRLGRETDKRLTNFDAKIDETATKQSEAIKALDNKVEAVAKEIVDQFDGLKSKSLALGIVSMDHDPKNKLLSCIPDAERHNIAFREIESREETKGSLSADPVTRAAMDRWFRLATMAQGKRWKAQSAEIHTQLEKLNKAFADVYGGVETKAAFTGGTDATGGYGVPDLVAAEVLRIVRDYGLALNLCRQIPMGSDTLRIPNEFNHFTTYWISEAATLTGGETTLAANTLNAKKIIARATASSEAVEDIQFNLLGYVRAIMGERIAEAIDVQVWEGTGSVFTGLVTESAVNSVATTTTDGARISYANLVKAIYSAKFASTRAGAAFVMHPAIFASIIGLTDTNGQPIVQLMNVPGTIQERLLGYPVYLTSALSITITRGATGNTGNVYFGPMQKLLLGVRRGLQWDVTDQVNWATDQIDCRMIGRFGFTVATPGVFSKIVGGTQLP